MTDNPGEPTGDLEHRVTVLERELARVREQLTATAAQTATAGTDAAAARTLAAGADHDVSEVRAELRAHTQVLNALRGDQLDLRALVTDGFTDIRARLDATAAGQQHIVDLLTTLIDGQQD